MLTRQSRRLWLLVIGMCLALILAACKATPEPTAAALTEPTRTAKPTFTPAPTATQVPTQVPPTATPTPTPEPTANPNINPLTGLAVDDPALLERRVLAVRVGNDAVIRPQEGLSKADVVYEEIMEGWTMTRFTALYLGSDAERVRPIRSARLSSLAIAPQYNAVLVHSGASDRIRWLISQAKSFTDLDQYFHDAPYLILPGYDWRGRMYTSVERVHEYLLGRGLESKERIVGYAFDEAAPVGEAALSINIPYVKVCEVDWAYDAALGAYVRSVAGAPHLDGLTGAQLKAENVIVLYADHLKTDIVEDSLGSTAIDIVLTGSGRAQLFRDGVVVECTWRRPEDGGLIQYYDANGVLTPLKPGQTWIELVPPEYEIVFN